MSFRSTRREHGATRFGLPTPTRDASNWLNVGRVCLPKVLLVRHSRVSLNTNCLHLANYRLKAKGLLHKITSLAWRDQYLDSNHTYRKQGLCMYKKWRRCVPTNGPQSSTTPATNVQDCFCLLSSIEGEFRYDFRRYNFTCFGRYTYLTQYHPI